MGQFSLVISTRGRLIDDRVVKGHRHVDRCRDIIVEVHRNFVVLLVRLYPVRDRPDRVASGRIAPTSAPIETQMPHSLQRKRL